MASYHTTGKEQQKVNHPPRDFHTAPGRAVGVAKEGRPHPNIRNLNRVLGMGRDGDFEGGVDRLEGANVALPDVGMGKRVYYQEEEVELVGGGWLGIACSGSGGGGGSGSGSCTGGGGGGGGGGCSVEGMQKFVGTQIVENGCVWAN